MLSKKEQKIKNMRYAGHIIFLIQQEAKKWAKPGVSLLFFDQLAEKIMKKYHVKPLFKDYYGYQHNICISLNSIVVHGVPSERVLKEGDLFTLDVGVRYKGYCADGATTFTVGKVSEKNLYLLNATQRTLQEVIRMLRPGMTLGDIGYFIHWSAKKYGFEVSKQYAGHFIGKDMHEDPLVLNYGELGKGLVLKEGMTLCIEPIFIDGAEDFFVDPYDKWSVITKHGGYAVHEEQMVLITENGSEVLIN